MPGRANNRAMAVSTRFGILRVIHEHGGRPAEPDERDLVTIVQLSDETEEPLTEIEDVLAHLLAVVEKHGNPQ